jgi:hypothetical protein
MTPGSARAWTEKNVVKDGSAAATAAARDDIGVILGKGSANQNGPGPQGARVDNSPHAGAMRHPQHGKGFTPDR